MKINKRVKKVSRRQLNLYLIEARVYENSAIRSKTNKLFNNNNLNKIIISFKKALSVIFKYHKLKKKILFVGAPYQVEQMINKETIHLSVPEMTNIRSVILSTTLLNGLKLNTKLKKKTKFVLSKINQQPHLIIIFNSSKSDLLINESFSLKIPVIHFEYSDKKQYTKQTYSIPGNFKSSYNKINENNIFYILLNSVFKNR